MVAAVLAAGAIALASRRGWFRLPTDPQREPVHQDAAAWLIGLFLLQILAPALPVLATQGSIATDTIAGRASLQWLAYAAQLPLAIVIVLRVGGLFRSPVRSVGAALVGLACAIPVIVVGSQLGTLIQRLATGAPPGALAHETLRALIEHGHDPWAWAVIAAVTIGAPIFEEIAYRGALHGAMRALGISPWSTILLTSVFFAIMHLGAIPPESLGGAMTGLAVLSVALGMLRQRTGGLIAPIVAHSIFNVANLAMAWAFSGS